MAWNFSVAPPRSEITWFWSWGRTSSFSSPAGFELLARPVGHFAPQPAGACGQQLELPGVTWRSRRIAKAGRVDLVGVLLQRHLLGVFQIDLSVDQVVLQSLGPGLQMIHAAR